MIRLLLAPALCLVALFAACSSAPKSSSPQQPEPPPPVTPQVVSPRDRAQIHTDLAEGYYERGRMDIALEELNEAVGLDPSNAKTYNVFGLVYATMGDNRQAEQSFQRALALAPQDSDFRHNWGWFLCSTDRARESIAEFEQAARNPLYRTPENALINAGKCSASFGDTAAAQNFYRRALAASPNNPTAAYGLAFIAYKESRLADARGYLRPVMLQTAPPPEALYLGMCVERKLGDRQAELSYSSQLRNRFPESAETKAIPTGNCE
ncbi:MAG: type IV pilus biogenesis/stability protein PilW [Aromatoleum sp.]|nr:type IV pilus biogenesis/stability protein PilW [Aromatoleum sp.]